MKTLSAITLDATPSAAAHTLHAAAAMSSSTTTRATGATAQHVQATGKSVALSSVAKTLTGYMLGDLLTLPAFLQGYGNQLRIVIGGAGVVGVLYNYSQRLKDKQTKMQHAVFRVVRSFERLTDEECEQLLSTVHTVEHLQQELLRLISEECETMFGPLMTRSEREATALHAKRKLLSNAREYAEEIGRLRQDSALVTDAVQRRAAEEEEVAQVEYGAVIPGFVVHSPCSEDQPPREQDAQDVDLLDNDSPSSPARVTVSVSSLVRSPPQPSTPGIQLSSHSLQSSLSTGGRSTYSVSNSSSSSMGSSPLAIRARPSNPTPYSSQGFYNGQDESPFTGPSAPTSGRSLRYDIFDYEDASPPVRPSAPTPRRGRGISSDGEGTPNQGASHGAGHGFDYSSPSPQSIENPPAEQPARSPGITYGLQYSSSPETSPVEQSEQQQPKELASMPKKQQPVNEVDESIHRNHRNLSNNQPSDTPRYMTATRPRQRAMGQEVLERTEDLSLETKRMLEQRAMGRGLQDQTEGKMKETAEENGQEAAQEQVQEDAEQAPQYIFQEGVSMATEETILKDLEKRPNFPRQREHRTRRKLASTSPFLLQRRRAR
jgi:hypothetical protein